VPTTIVFPGGSGESDMTLAVQEEPAEVLDAFIAAQGIPFKLTGSRGKDVWVNPDNIAYWRDRSGQPISIG
jgi:hypothetical protein